MGYVLFALGVFSTAGTAGGLFHLINHAFSKGLLFMTAGAVIHQTGLRDITKMGGLKNTMPITAFAAAIGALSIAGSPPLSGFASEWLIFAGGAQAALTGGIDLGMLILTVLAGSSSILSAGYMLRFLWRVFFGPTPDSLEDTKESPWSMTGPMIVLGVIIVIFGIFPSLALDVILPAVSSIAGMLPITP
jgi:formate hydrogenlyase subunit 3/multisubunit Na+/H+ antiporter MnhD subunit